VLFVARIFTYYDSIYVPPLSIAEFEEKILAGGKRRLEEFVEEHLKGYRAAAVKVVAGDPADEIIRYIAEEGMDLVIMGTHGRKGLDRILFGSVANRLVTTSPVPVMTVNPYRKKK
jgi:nucleotide-binding universal stress UspA family protein